MKATTKQTKSSRLYYRLVSFGRAEVRNKAGRVVYSGSPVKAWQLAKGQEVEHETLSNRMLFRDVLE